MLTLTENATRVIGALVDDPEMPDGGGLRIATAAEGLTVAPAEEPEESDQVIEDQAARVFVEPQAAVALDDKVLDAQMDDQGRVQFVLGQR